jgi:hypothetical protein
MKQEGNNLNSTESDTFCIFVRDNEINYIL